MDPTVSIAPTPFPNVVASSSDLPVARLTRATYMEDPEATFFLYPGRNLIGSNPFMVNVYIPQGHSRDVDEIHAVIDISENNMVLVQDPFPRDETEATILGDAILRPGMWIEMNQDRVLKVAGIPFHIEFVRPEQLEKSPPERSLVPEDITLERERQLESYFKYHPRPLTRVMWKKWKKRIRGTTGQQEVPDNSDSGDTDVHPGSQEENLGNQGEHSRSQAEILDDEPIEPTLVIASLTLSYRYDNDSPEPEELENEDLPHFHVKQGPILPPDLISSNNPFASSASSSARHGGPGPSHARIVDHDAPTQLVDANDGLPSEDTQHSYDSQFAEAPTLPYIYDDIAAVASTSPVVQESHQPALSSSSSTSLSRTGARRVQDALRGVDETQSTHEEGATSSGSSPYHVRQTSAEPGSPEVSQIVSGSSPERNHGDEDRVPATPAELIDVPPTASRDNFQSVDPRSSSDPVIGEHDHVLGTPEEKRYTAMSEISAFETQGELSDESSGSVAGTDPTHSGDLSAKQKQDDNNTLPKGVSQTTTSAHPAKSGNRDPEEDDVEERPLWRHRQTVRLNKKEIRESSLSSISNTEESSSKGTFSGTADTTMDASADPPSQVSPPKSKEGSPKHSMDSDAEEGPPKPTKLIKTGSVDEQTKRRPTRTSSMNEDTGTPSFRRASSSRTLTRRTTSDMDLQKPGVMVSTGMGENQKKHYYDVINSLGGAVKEDYKEATILVFESTWRTTKLMCAIVRCLPIVTPKWLEDSVAQKKFLRWEDYLVKDSEVEKKFKFNLAESCRLAKVNENNGLLQGLNFHIVTAKPTKKNADKNPLTRDTVAPMIEVCGGKIHKTALKDAEPGKVIIVANEHCNTTKSLLARNFTIVKVEFFLSAITQQRVDFTEHLLGAHDNVIHHSDEGEGDEDESRPDSKGKASTRPSKSLSRSTSTVSATGSITSRGGSQEMGVMAGPSSPPSGTKGGRRGSTVRRTKSSIDEDDPMPDVSPPSASQTKTGRAGRTSRKKVSVDESEDDAKPMVAPLRKTKSSTSFVQPSAMSTDEGDTSTNAESSSTPKTPKPRRIPSSTQRKKK